MAGASNIRSTMIHVKELAKIAKEAEAQGWTISITNGGHLKWVSPTGRCVFTAQTPSDVRAYHRIRSDLRRMGFIDIKPKKARRK